MRAVPFEAKRDKGMAKSDTMEGVQTGNCNDQGVLTYSVGKLTLHRKEFCFTSKTEMSAMLLTGETQATLSISWKTWLFGLV